MLNRMEHARADAVFVQEALRNPDARFVIYAGTDVLLRSALPIAPLTLSETRLAELDVPLLEPVFLGLDGSVPWFALDLGSSPKSVSKSLAALGRFVALGSIQDPVEGEDWSVFAQARALLAWNARSRHCPTCGAPAEMHNAGYLRVCSNSACGATHFPRSDPAIIVRVTHGDRCLLARQPSFRAGLHSVLAGFVEPGESLEAAVAREVEEEVGLRLESLSYVGSQPWPFPTSIMVGFAAEAAGDEIHIEGCEIESAKWTTRAQARQAMRNGSLVLPSVKSIARRLIDDWLDAE